VEVIDDAWPKKTIRYSRTHGRCSPSTNRPIQPRVAAEKSRRISLRRKSRRSRKRSSSFASWESQRRLARLVGSTPWLWLTVPGIAVQGTIYSRSREEIYSIWRRQTPHTLKITLQGSEAEVISAGGAVRVEAFKCNVLAKIGSFLLLH
jgi:hypothetical protein